MKWFYYFLLGVFDLVKTDSSVFPLCKSLPKITSKYFCMFTIVDTSVSLYTLSYLVSDSFAESRRALQADRWTHLQDPWTVATESRLLTACPGTLFLSLSAIYVYICIYPALINYGCKLDTSVHNYKCWSIQVLIIT